MAMDGDVSSNRKNFSFEEQRKKLYERVNSTVSSLVLPDESIPSQLSENESYSSKHKVAAWSLQITRCHTFIFILFSILTMGYYLSSLRLMIF